MVRLTLLLPQGDRSDPEIASWLEWRAKNRPAKPLLGVINRPPTAFASLAAAAGVGRPLAKPNLQQVASPQPSQQTAQQQLLQQQQQQQAVVNSMISSSNSSSPKLPVVLPSRPVLVTSTAAAAGGGVVPSAVLQAVR